jgi:uncharacterized protein
MPVTNIEIPSRSSQLHTQRTRRLIGVVFAIAFPSLITWLYFVAAGRYSSGAQQSTFLIVKVIQFAFPALWTYFALREQLRTARPTARGLLLGAVFSAVVVAAGMTLFKLALLGTPAFSTAADSIRQKLSTFGIDSAWKYAVLCLFYSLFHSLLEEYYWRWFVFRQLRELMSLWPAVVLSAVAFTLHHVIVLSVYFKSAPWLVALLSVGVAIGGAFWAWLYNRSGSIFDTWLSHLLIDAGIFFGVGYELLKHTFAVAS